MSWTVDTANGAKFPLSTLPAGEFEYELERYRVATCDTCGAVVMDDNAKQHVEWHVSQAAAVKAVTERLADVCEFNRLGDGS